METERAKRLADFVTWVGANIRGDEKGEAQVYLDRLFRALGHAGVKEAGAVLETRIKQADGKGTAVDGALSVFEEFKQAQKQLAVLGQQLGHALRIEVRRTAGPWNDLIGFGHRWWLLCRGFDNPMIRIIEPPEPPPFRSTY